MENFRIVYAGLVSYIYRTEQEHDGHVVFNSLTKAKQKLIGMLRNDVNEYNSLINRILKERV